MTSLRRHTLCWLEFSALEDIAAQMDRAYSALPAVQRQQAREYLLSGLLPGIVRRGGQEADNIPLGICFPMRHEGQRLRLAVEAPLSAIRRHSTPEQTACIAISGRSNAVRAFNALLHAWRWPEIQPGVWGSVALEIVTPWLWTDARSDLDIRLVPGASVALSECWASICNIERQFQLRIDGEICLSNGYAINIKEWFSGSSTLLAKGESDVQLISRQQVTSLMRTSFC